MAAPRPRPPPRAAPSARPLLPPPPPPRLLAGIALANEQESPLKMRKCVHHRPVWRVGSAGLRCSVTIRSLLAAMNVLWPAMSISRPAGSCSRRPAARPSQPSSSLWCSEAARAKSDLSMHVQRSRGRELIIRTVPSIRERTSIDTDYSIVPHLRSVAC